MAMTRIKTLIGGLLEPFLGRRHRFYLARTSELEARIARIEGDSGRRDDIERLERKLGDWRLSQSAFAALQQDIAELKRAREDGVRDRLDALRETIDRERANLGMVAGGLDSLRNQIEDFDMARGRFEAYEKALMELAARIDLLANQAKPEQGLSSLPKTGAGSRRKSNSEKQL
jgi:chromosome segregation ATPase